MNISLDHPFSEPRSGGAGPASASRPVVAFVRLSLPEGIDRTRARSVALEARQMFEGMPALRSKVFTFCERTREVVNVYLWESEQAARAFFTEPLLALVGERYGARPRVELAQIDAMVDNTGGIAGL